MADSTQRREILDELEEAIEGYEEENSSNEFTEGAVAVIKFLTTGDPADVPGFMKEYGLTGA